MKNAISILGFLILLNPLQLNASKLNTSHELFIRNSLEVTPNIYRGPRPSFEDLEFLKSRGIKTIINIENDRYALSRDKEYAQKLGLKWISSPMSAEVYPNDKQLEFLQKQLNDENNFPIFLHCKHGEDRTGLIVGLYRVMTQKWSAEKAYKEMLQNGFHPRYQPLDQCYRDKTGYKE